MVARTDQPPPTAPVQTPAPADRPAPPLQELTFDISAFLGDDPADQLLMQSLLEAPPASVPTVLPQPTPAAAAGQGTSSRQSYSPFSSTSTSQTRAATAGQRRQLENARRIMRKVRTPAVSELPPGVTQLGAMTVMFHYEVAKERSHVDDSM